MSQYNIDYLKTLPIEMIEKALLNLSVDDLHKLCSTDTYINQLCKDENYWINRLMKKYNKSGYELEIEWGSSFQFYPSIWWDDVEYAYEHGKPVLLSNTYGGYDRRPDSKDYVISIVPQMTMKDVLNIVNRKFPNNKEITVTLFLPFVGQESFHIRYNNDEILFKRADNPDLEWKQDDLNSNILDSNLYNTILFIITGFINK